MDATLTTEIPSETAFLDALRSIVGKVREPSEPAYEKTVYEKTEPAYEKTVPAKTVTAYNKALEAGAHYRVLGSKFEEEAAFALDPTFTKPPVISPLRVRVPVVKGYVGIADAMRALRIVEKMEPKSKIRAKAIQIAAASESADAAAAFWPDEGLSHPPLKNVGRVHVRLNQVGPIRPRLAFDPDSE